MRVFLIGATGQIGYETARALCARGHEVTGLALSPAPRSIELPDGMKLIEGNYRSYSEEELMRFFSGHEGLVLAAGFNENHEDELPVEETFYKKDVAPLRRLLPVARKCGIKNVVIAGSYYAYFARLWKEMELEVHPYVKTCVEQENVALSFADGSLHISILEFPIVVGGGQWSEPLILDLVKSAKEHPKYTTVPRGGTAFITVRQAAQAMAGALEQGRGGKTFPIGYYNMQWTDMAKIIHQQLGTPDKRVKIYSGMALQSRMKRVQSSLTAVHRGRGVEPVGSIPFLTAETFVDKRTAVERFGVEEDNFEMAVSQSVRRCLEILPVEKPQEKEPEKK